MPIVSPRCSFGPPFLRITSPWVNAHAIWRVKSLNSLRETTLPVGKSIKASPSGSYLSLAPRRWVHTLQSGIVTEGSVDVWMRGTIGWDAKKPGRTCCRPPGDHQSPGWHYGVMRDRLWILPKSRGLTWPHTAGPRGHRRSDTGDRGHTDGALGIGARYTFP